MNESFLKLAAASLIVVASASAINCTSQQIDPAPGVQPQIIIEDIEVMGDIELTGIVIDVSDSTVVKVDSVDVDVNR